MARVLLALVIGAVLGACDLTGEQLPAPPESDSAGMAPTVVATIRAPGGDGCGLEARTGVRNIGIDVLGQQRTARLYIPRGYDPGQPVPLVLNFQGNGLHAPEYNGYTRFSAAVDAGGFIGVLPDVDQSLGGWRVDVGARIDIEFVETLIAALERDFCVDEARVYAVGYSGGAAFAHILACSGTQLAGLAVVAAPRTTPCLAARPLAVIGFHGVADPLQPYGVVEPDSWAAGWAQVAGCRFPPFTANSTVDYQESVFTSCQFGAPVEFYAIESGGHTWPGAEARESLGATTAAINATDEIVRFFGLGVQPEP